MLNPNGQNKKGGETWGKQDGDPEEPPPAEILIIWDDDKKVNLEEKASRWFLSVVWVLPESLGKVEGGHRHNIHWTLSGT